MKNQEKQYKSTTHEERFTHIREGLQSDKYGAATVFTRKEADGLWYAAVALCHKADQFDRSRGRKNARRNYFKNTYGAVRVLSCIGGKWDFYFVLQYAIYRAYASEVRS